MPMTPNATRNGTNGAMREDCWVLMVRYDWVPVTAPRGSAAVTAATSARTAAAEPALANRYSNCAAGCAPAPRRLATCAGSTQPAAELLADQARPTPVSPGRPGP